MIRVNDAYWNLRDPDLMGAALADSRVDVDDGAGNFVISIGDKTVNNANFE